MAEGTLYVISAASGTGKTSLVKAITSKLSDILVSISYTTRPMRAEEENGVNYHFIPREKFEQMIQDNSFLEFAEVFGHLYGTGQEWVMQQLQKGKDVILEIDWQGAEQIRRLMPENTVGIFILPPSLQTLRDRLEKRGQDSAEVINHRLNEARHEISHCSEFDYLVINDNFDQALSDLLSIIRSHRLAIVPQAEKFSVLLTDLIR